MLERKKSQRDEMTNFFPVSFMATWVTATLSPITQISVYLYMVAYNFRISVKIGNTPAHSIRMSSAFSGNETKS